MPCNLEGEKGNEEKISQAAGHALISTEGTREEQTQIIAKYIR